MPKEAVKLGAVDEIVPLPEIPRAIIRILEPGSQPHNSSRQGGS
jgi:chemotaxis response regulator CheB